MSDFQKRCDLCQRRCMYCDGTLEEGGPGKSVELCESANGLGPLFLSNGKGLESGWYFVVRMRDQRKRAP